MAKLYLVRHGEAAAAWGDHDDPGLSPLGVRQAAHAAGLIKAFAPLEVWTSPLLRCRETAAAYEMESGAAARIEPAVTEIPTPANVGDRQTWLRSTMQGDWTEAADLAPWREALVRCLAAAQRDTVVFTHFVAINVAVGASEGSQAVTVFRPANCSITVLEAQNGALRTLQRGEEAPAIRVL